MGSRAALVARTPGNVPVRRLQIVLPFLSYYYTAYYNILVFVYVSCQCHVAAFVCMYVGCICYMTNKYQRGNYYVYMYVVLGTNCGESGFGMFRCFVNTLFLYMFIIIQYSMYVCAEYVSIIRHRHLPRRRRPPSRYTYMHTEISYFFTFQ